MNYYDDEELEDFYAQQRYERVLFRHPDCGDPAHPGCAGCREEDEE